MYENHEQNNIVNCLDCEKWLELDEWTGKLGDLGSASHFVFY